MSNQLKAGIARSAVTPPVGISLAGYATRPSSAVGVHDDLFCKAVVFSNGEMEAALVCLDLLGLDFEQVRIIRDSVQSRYGIPGESIFIACSHTHAGPATQQLRFCGTPDPGYLSRMFQVIVETVGQAKKDLSPCRILTGETTADLAINRRKPADGGGIALDNNRDGICDHQVKLVRIIRDGKPGAVIFNYSCHGVVLGADNVYVSADWIGAASAFIENETSDTAMFLQGCCGDINPRIRGGFDAVREAGELVGRAVTDALSKMTGHPDSTELSVKSIKVELPYQPLPSIEELARFNQGKLREIEQGRSEGKPEHMLDWPKGQEEWSRVAMERLQNGGSEKSVEIELAALQIDGVRIFAIPGEVFTGYALSIKSLGPDVLVAGYANGNIGYVPTEKAFSEGGYEVDAAYQLYGVQMIGPESEGVITSAAREILGK